MQYIYYSNNTASISSYWAAHSADSSVASKHPQYESWASVASASSSRVASKSSTSANNGAGSGTSYGAMMFTIASFVFMILYTLRRTILI